MHNNALIHTAHIIRDWLEENGIDVIDYSPNLNPIEIIWALLKAEMYRLFPDLAEMANTEATKKYLINCAIQTWY